MEFPQSLTRTAVARLVRPTAAERDRKRWWDPELFTALAAADDDGPGLAGPLVAPPGPPDDGGNDGDPVRARVDTYRIARRQTRNGFARTAAIRYQAVAPVCRYG